MRLSSCTALAGMSSLLWAFMPLILRSALESRWPSVVTTRSTSPASSKSAAERCGRVSSADMENCVSAMSSATSSAGMSVRATLLGSGRVGKSSPGMPLRSKRRLPDLMRAEKFFSTVTVTSPSGSTFTTSNTCRAGRATVPPLRTSALQWAVTASVRSVAASRTPDASATISTFVRMGIADFLSATLCTRLSALTNSRLLTTNSIAHSVLRSRLSVRDPFRFRMSSSLFREN